MDYRIHSGLVGGRWVRDQKAHIVRLAEQIYKVSWDEPTGTAVSLTFMLATRRRTARSSSQLDRERPGQDRLLPERPLDEMRAYRDAGPTYPKLVLDGFDHHLYRGLRRGRRKHDRLLSQRAARRIR